MYGLCHLCLCFSISAVLYFNDVGMFDGGAIFVWGVFFVPMIINIIKSRTVNRKHDNREHFVICEDNVHLFW